MRSLTTLGLLWLLAGTAHALAPCSDEAREAGWAAPAVLRADGETIDVERLADELAGTRVVYVGEVHDRLDHHLNQLEIVCRMRRHGPLAIGLEYFQTPAQRALDDYVHRHGDLDRLLAESEWFTRWRFDPRLYEPILRFARRHRIDLVALNVPGELVSRVARGGLASLDEADRARLPASVERGPARYRERIEQVFRQHAAQGYDDFENFLDAQLTWDEGMAQRAAEALLEHPGRRLVVLAGEGHVAWGDPIPDRLARRVAVPRALVLQSHPGAPPAAASDYRLLSEPIDLPAPGRLGVTVEERADGVEITGFGQSSAARDAGLLAGDRLVELDGRPLAGYADVRLALWRMRPGDAVTIASRRGDRITRLTLELR